MPKLDTTAQSEAAEIRTVAELLDRGLVAGQYPRSYPRIDVYAFDPEVRRVVNVQVKYRHAAGAGRVVVKEAGAVEFLVLCRANRGTPVGGRTAMQTWVVPAPEVTGSEIRFASLSDRYLLAWDLIVDACRTTAKTSGQR